MLQNNSPLLLIGEHIAQWFKYSLFTHEYVRVLRQLHGEQFSCTEKELRELLRQPTELVVFISDRQRLLATAQASLQKTLPIHQVAINNVVVDNEHRGRGLGAQVLTKLEEAAISRWGVHRQIRFTLTNSPAKGSGGFYDRLGYRSRGLDSGNPTVVWVKQT